MEGKEESDHPRGEVKHRGTGSLFEIKMNVKKEGYRFILILSRIQIMK